MKPIRFLQRYFYLFMTLLIAAVAFYGFRRTIDHNLLHASPIPPIILTLHALVFPGWLLFLILQSALVRTRNVRIHRTLGWFGLALGVTLVVVGFLTARGMDRFHNTLHPDVHISAFLIIQLMALVLFAPLFALAIYWRRRPEFHRRLILIATCVLTDAAWARFPHSSLILATCGVDFLILLGVLRDLIVDRRVNKVYLYAWPVVIAAQVLANYTFSYLSPWWLKIANVLLS